MNPFFSNTTCTWHQYYRALKQRDIAGAAEATTGFWTDGPRRAPEQVNAQARARIVEMTTQQIQRHGDFMAHEEHMILLEPPAINRLTEVRVPTLIVLGDEDVQEVIDVAEVLEQGIPGAKKVVIPGTAHHPHMEKPEEFNRVVLDFLNGLPRQVAPFCFIMNGMQHLAGMPGPT